MGLGRAVVVLGVCAALVATWHLIDGGAASESRLEGAGAPAPSPTPANVRESGAVAREVLTTTRARQLAGLAEAATSTGPATLLLRGRVLEGGAPVPGAVVRYVAGELATLTSTRTDASGRFVLPVAEATSIVLEASRSGGSRGQRSVDVGWRVAPEVVIELERGAELQVRVVGPDGRPVAGARVSCIATRGSTDLLTDEDELARSRFGPVLSDPEGRAAIAILAAGPYEVEAEHDAVGIVVEIHELEMSGRAAPIELRIPGGRPIAGRLLHADGRPQSGVGVMLAPAPAVLQSGYRAARTDDGGYFTITGVAPGDYALGFWGACDEEPFPISHVADGPAQLHQVIAGARATIRGTVVGPHGAALAGWSIEARDKERDDLNPTTSASDGSFEVEVCPGREYYVSAVATPVPGEMDGEVLASELAFAGDDGVRLVVAATATLEGSVVFQGGAPPARYVVMVDGVRHVVEVPRFSVPGLSPDHAWIEVTADGFVFQRQFVELRPGETTVVDVTLRPGHTVVGQIVDAETGGPVSGARVSAWTAEPVDMAGATSDAAGRFVLAGLPPGSATLHVSQHRHYKQALSGPIEVRADAPPVLIELVRGATVRGSVRLGRAAAHRVSVRLESLDLPEWVFATHLAILTLDGRFEVRGVIPGAYAWALVGPGDHERRGTVVVPASGLDGMVLELGDGAVEP